MSKRIQGVEKERMAMVGLRAREGVEGGGGRVAAGVVFSAARPAGQSEGAAVMHALLGCDSPSAAARHHQSLVPALSLLGVALQYCVCCVVSLREHSSCRGRVLRGCLLSDPHPD